MCNIYHEFLFVLFPFLSFMFLCSYNFFDAFSCSCFTYYMHVYKYLFIHTWHIHLCTHDELLGPYTQVHGSIGSGD